MWIDAEKIRFDDYDRNDPDSEPMTEAEQAEFDREMAEIDRQDREDREAQQAWFDELDAEARR